ncbi:MAG: YkgJ family cysteine cluster protein [Novosphingobium sp.]
MTAPALAQSDICTACGMCCDGTLFARVLAKPDEVEALRQTGFTLTPFGTELGFSQPCVQLCGTRCGVYAARPQVCRTYTCPTLDAVADGTIGADEAMRRVVAVRTATDNLKAEFLPGENVQQARLRFHKAVNADEGAAVTPKFKLLLGVVEVLLDRHFRHPGQRAFGAMS